jgi:hypothetical protein
MVVGLLVAVGAAGCGGPTTDARPEVTSVTTEPPTSADPSTSPDPSESPELPESPGASETSAPSGTQDDPLPSSAQPAPMPAPAVLTQDDDGSAVSLAMGSEVSLRLDSAWSWSEPDLDGDAVVLTPVAYFDDPGFVEWVVTGTSPGRTTLRTEGAPACDDPAACPPRELTIDVVVTG